MTQRAYLIPVDFRINLLTAEPGGPGGLDDPAVTPGPDGLFFLAATNRHQVIAIVLDPKTAADPPALGRVPRAAIRHATQIAKRDRSPHLELRLEAEEYVQTADGGQFPRVGRALATQRCPEKWHDACVPSTEPDHSVRVHAPALASLFRAMGDRLVTLEFRGQATPLVLRDANRGDNAIGCAMPHREY